MVSDLTVHWKNSRYNFSLNEGGRVALYNALTGAINVLEGEDASALAEHLCQSPRTVDVSELDAAFVDEMAVCGFLVREDQDEVEIIASRFNDARNETPAVLTITTTQDCNLGCYYCYEKRLASTLGLADVEKIYRFAEAHVNKHQLTKLHVNWYGGEPLLNMTFIEALSPRLQEMCARFGVEYRASIISNGTLWPDDIGNFVRCHALVQAQISFDGLSRNHNKRRHMLRSHRDADQRSPFERATQLVDQLTKYTRVDIRLNLDRNNATDMEAFIDFAVERGWFQQTFSARIQIAKISNYTERTNFWLFVESSGGFSRMKG